MTNVDELWKALLTTTTDPRTLIDYGAVFALHGMAVDTLGMKIGGAVKNTWVAGSPIPEFTWAIPAGISFGTRPAGLLLNEFQVDIYDVAGNTYTKVFGSPVLSKVNARLSVNGNTASWVPSKQDWQTILQSGGTGKAFVIRAGDFHLMKFGHALTRLKTGPYWSDKFSFTATP